MVIWGKSIFEIEENVGTCTLGSLKERLSILTGVNCLQMKLMVGGGSLL